jgi:hypothetical protein
MIILLDKPSDGVIAAAVKIELQIKHLASFVW